MRVSDSEAAGHAGHEGTRARLLAANDSRIADGLTPRSRARDRQDASVSRGERETPVADDTRASEARTGSRPLTRLALEHDPVKRRAWQQPAM
jgi:hypothetical protein